MAMNSSSYQQGMMLGRYQLSRMIGQGATGEVWAAYDTSLRRQVAIKMLPPVLANDKTYLQLFTREAQAAASLDHPYILPVHDYGQQRSEDNEIITYLVMPLVTGGTLRDRIRAANGPLPLIETVKYLAQAAQAIDYAHSRQIIHRDIKPGNMLLQNDWLYLTDFGIAKLMTGDTRRSQTVSGSGTPEYIAPEQAQGHAVPASDLYSLAIVAYQMLTGRLPFQGEAVYQILLKQISEMPPPPRQFNPQIPPAVEQVILRGMAKRPEERYQTCTEFMQALQQSSQPLGNPAAAASWNQSQYLTTPLTPPSGPVFASQSLPQTSYAPQPPTDLSRLPYQPGLTPPPPPSAPFPPPTGGPSNGKQPLGRRTFLIAGTAAAAAVVTGGTALAYYLQNRPSPLKPTPTPTPAPGPQKLMSGVPLLSLTGHNDIVRDVVWHPSGRYLATAGDDTRVMVWDVGSALQKSSNSVQTHSQPLYSWKLDNKLADNYLHWTSDGRYLVASTNDSNAFYVIDVFTSNSQPQKYSDAAQINTFLPPLSKYVAARPGQNEVAVSEYSLLFTQATVGLWKIGHTQGPVRTYTVNMSNSSIGHIGWSKDGTMLAISSPGGREVAIVDAESGNKLNDLTVPDRTQGKNPTIIRVQLVWSPMDRNTFAAFDLDAIVIYNIHNPHDTLHPLMLGTDDISAHTPPKGYTLNVDWFPEVNGIDWSPNGRYIVASYISSAKLYIWDLQDPHPRKSQDGRQQQKLIFPPAHSGGHTDTVTDVSWSPNGRYIASGSMDTTAIVWKVDAE